MKFTSVLQGHNIPDHIKAALEEQPARSGMYNWIFALKGEINPYHAIRDDLEKYDVIQLNMSPADMNLIPEIRQRLGRSSSTKLVLNNDYVCEYWGKWGIDPLRYDQMQRQGDMVFGTEPHQVSNMINGAFCIPHPTNTSMLKRLGHDKSKDENAVGFIYHWWAAESYLAHRTLRHVRAKYGAKDYVFGYEAHTDPMKPYHKQMFQHIQPLMHFPDFMDMAQRMRCLYDPNPCHTYGRNGVEAACLGIPVVGSDRVFSYKTLFPEWTNDPYDHIKTMAKFKSVFEDKKRTQEILDQAYDKVEAFNYKNSKDKFMAALEESDKRGGFKWNEKQRTL